MDAQQRQQYWRENLKIMAILLVIWAAVSYGAGILFVDQLNNLSIMGTRSGSGSPSRARS